MSSEPEAPRVKRKYVRKPKKHKGGRPAYVANDKDRAVVRWGKFIKRTQEEIADLVGIDPKLLRRHYRKELDHGKLEGDLMIGQVAFELMTGGAIQNHGKTNWRDANPMMVKHYGESQFGWTTKQQVEHGGIDGAAIKIESLSDAQIDYLIARVTAGDKGAKR